MIKYAVTDEQIQLVKAANSQKIQNINKTQAEALIEVVGKWGFYLGAKNLSSDDILLLCKFLRESYSTLTVQEISLSINLVLSGKLGKIEFYGSLTPIYMSEVLNAYISYRRENLTEVLQKAEKENLPKTPPMSEEESQKIIEEAIFHEYQKFKKTGSIDDYFSMIYNHLTKIGTIIRTKEKDKIAKEFAVSQLERNRVKKATNIGDLIKDAYKGDEQAEINRYCKNYYVISLFSEITDIKTFISSLRK